MDSRSRLVAAMKFPLKMYVMATKPRAPLASVNRSAHEILLSTGPSETSAMQVTPACSFCPFVATILTEPGGRYMSTLDPNLMSPSLSAFDRLSPPDT